MATGSASLGHAGLLPEVERAGLDRNRLGAFERARPWNPRVAEPGVRSMLAWLPLASDRGIGRDLEAAIARSTTCGESIVGSIGCPGIRS